LAYRWLQDTSYGGPVAQLATGSRRHQQRRYYLHPGGPGDWAVQDGHERIGRRPRVAGGQSQRRRCDAHLCAGPLVLVQLGEHLLGASGRRRQLRDAFRFGQSPGGHA